MLTLEGIVEDIIFRNENNGYTVARLSTEDGIVTIVGKAAIIDIDDLIEVKGRWIYHDTFGEQLEFESIKLATPSTLEGIEKYLASGVLPYVGPKTAKDIVNRFGKESLDIIQYNPERLKEIPGIGQKKFERIAESYEENRELRDIMVYLQQYDISVNNSIKIYKQYGSETMKIISENPYRLSEDVPGIGFKTADNVAQNMGIEIDSPFRIEAGLKFALRQSSLDGHCYLPSEELVNRAVSVLGLKRDLVESGLDKLATSNNFHMYPTDDGFNVYYMPLFNAEMQVAQKLISISTVEFKKIDIDISKMIDEIEVQENIKFGNKQRIAIEESIKYGVTVITGGPGTGKTTTINAIIQIFEELDLKVELAAPTGRAAKRMTETSGRESKTIHRLLEFGFMEESSGMFNKGEEEPIESDVIIIDEASMIDIRLMDNLLKAIDPGTRLVLVGDVDQLPSVGPGNVLNDIISSECINVIELDEIFRQAEESMIVVNAHKINKGEFPLLNKKGKDFYFINQSNQESTLDTIVELNDKRLPSFYDLDPLEDIQILTPMRRGKVGTNELNKKLQETLNPPEKNKPEKVVGDTIFRVGDKVMQIKNNYNAKWKLINKGFEVEKGEGIFNGDFGYIKDIDDNSNTLVVLFDDAKEVEYDFKDLDELNLAYATTVHKAQGSEFPVIIMPIEWGPPMLMTRNLIYTAITRARELVVLVGNTKSLAMMINNNKIMKRYSTLDKMMNQYIEAYKIALDPISNELEN